MLKKLIDLIPNKKTRDVALAAGGMATVMFGGKLVGLGMFLKGAYNLEQHWREAHPNFDGDWGDRWQEAIEFYEATHCNPTNRRLHVIGIPMIVGGAAGLLLLTPFRPTWFAAATLFGAGWVLNIIGHAGFEKNAPAFADDPLSFIAGPVWDLQQLRNKRAAASTETIETPLTEGEAQVV